jgi:hypothetical protein
MLVPLYLLGELVPKLREIAPRLAILTSAALALVCLSLPLHLGVVVAIVAGLAVGGITLRRRARKTSTRETAEVSS